MHPIEEYKLSLHQTVNQMYRDKILKQEKLKPTSDLKNDYREELETWFGKTDKAGINDQQGFSQIMNPESLSETAFQIVNLKKNELEVRQIKS